MNDKSDGEEKNIGPFIFMHIPCITFQDPIANYYWPYAKLIGRTLRRTEPRTDPNQYAPLSFFEVGGITTESDLHTII